MKLLVPVNGSIESKNAVKKAIKIAYEYDFSIKLIHVIQPKEVSSEKRYRKLWHQVDGSLLSKRNESPMTTEKEATRLLNEITQTYNFIGIIIEKEVLIGRVSKKILETAKNENFDLIIMGNRKPYKMKRLFVGSITQKVLIKTPCPVLLIHNE